MFILRSYSLPHSLCLQNVNHFKCYLYYSFKPLELLFTKPEEAACLHYSCHVIVECSSVAVVIVVIVVVAVVALDYYPVVPVVVVPLLVVVGTTNSITEVYGILLIFHNILCKLPPYAHNVA